MFWLWDPVKIEEVVFLIKVIIVGNNKVPDYSN